MKSYYEIIKEAGFKGTKAVLSELVDDSEKEKFKYIINNLKPYEKYFPIIWDHIIKNPTDNINEVISDGRHVFKEFEGIRSNLPKKDFNDYESFNELSSVVNQYLLDRLNNQQQLRLLKNEEKAKTESEIIPGDSTLIYEDDEILTYRINSKQGANSLAGHDTSWCVTKLDQYLYEQYTSSNLIFYFCINKTLPLNDKLQKVAIRVMKNSDGSVNSIKYTNKLNDSDERNPEEIPWFNKIKSLIILDAEQQPESLFSKVENGRATIEDEEELWNNYRSSSIKEKQQLSYSSDFFQKRVRKLLAHKFTIEEVNTLNLKELDTATLEKIIRDVYDEDLYLRLSKFKYNPVDAALAEKTRNPKLLIELYSRGFENVIDIVVGNNKCPKIIVKDFLAKGGDLSKINRSSRTPELCKIWVEKDGPLHYVPEHVINLDIEFWMQKAIEYIENGKHLNNIPKQLRTPELCKIWVEKGGCISYVPEDLQKSNPELYSDLCEIFMEKGGHISYVPPELRTLDMCKKQIEQEGSLLYFEPYIYSDPEKYYEIAKFFVEKGGDILKVSPNYITPELRRIFIENGGSVDKLKSVEELVRLFAPVKNYNQVEQKSEDLESTASIYSNISKLSSMFLKSLKT